jgi:hypothetical protein
MTSETGKVIPAEELGDKELTLKLVLHILRNPWGWSDAAVRTARLWAADKLEQGERNASN